MKNYDAYIFDFDYTLVDTTKPIVECFRYTFETMHLEGFDKQKVIKTIGMTLDDAFSLLTGIKDKGKINEFVRVYSSKEFIGIGKIIRKNNTISVKSDKLFIV